MPDLNKLACIVGLIALAGGCATPAGTANTPAPAAQTPPQRPDASEKRFVIAPQLRGLLYVVSVRSSRLANGYLTIQVNLQNLTDAPQRFNYRIEWFDKDGARLPLASQASISWMLMAREMSSVVATAPTLMAEDFGIAFVPALNQE
jgi:uncharacterized protein YcfL